VRPYHTFEKTRVAVNFAIFFGQCMRIYIYMHTHIELHRYIQYVDTGKPGSEIILGSFCYGFNLEPATIGGTAISSFKG
jgi:hypothetical protein